MRPWDCPTPCKGTRPLNPFFVRVKSEGITKSTTNLFIDRLVVLFVWIDELFRFNSNDAPLPIDTSMCKISAIK